MKKICLSAMFGLAASLIEMNAEATKYGLVIGGYDDKLQTRTITITIDGQEYRTDVKALDKQLKDRKTDAELVGLGGFRLDRTDRWFEGANVGPGSQYICVRSEHFSVAFGYYNLEGKMTDFGETKVILNTNEEDEVHIKGKDTIVVCGESVYQNAAENGEGTKLRSIEVETDKNLAIGGKLKCNNIKARANEISFNFSPDSKIEELQFESNAARMDCFDVQFTKVNGKSLEGQRRFYGFDILNNRPNAGDAPTYCVFGPRIRTGWLELKEFGYVQLGTAEGEPHYRVISVYHTLNIDADHVKIGEGSALLLSPRGGNHRIRVAAAENFINEGRIGGQGAKKLKMDL